MSGPTTVLRSSGFPIASDLYAAKSLRRTLDATDSCMITRRVDVQRCPAVPTAPLLPTPITSTTTPAAPAAPEARSTGPLHDVPRNRTLVLSWGGTYGSVAAAVRRVRASDKKVAHAHLRYLNPFPRNTGEVVRGYEKVLVPEINLGQLQKLVRAEFLGCSVGRQRATERIGEIGSGAQDRVEQFVVHGDVARCGHPLVRRDERVGETCEPLPLLL